MINCLTFLSGTLLRNRWYWDLWSSARCVLVSRSELVKWGLALHLSSSRDCCSRWRCYVPHATSPATSELIQSLRQLTLRHKDWRNANRWCDGRWRPSRGSSPFRWRWATSNCMRLIRTETVENWLRLSVAVVSWS